MLMFQKNKFDSYCCKRLLCCLKTMEKKPFEKLNFCSTYIGAQKRERCVGSY